MQRRKFLRDSLLVGATLPSLVACFGGDGGGGGSAGGSPDIGGGLSAAAIDKLIYEFQDKYIDLKRLRDHIKELGGTITDLNDAYLGEDYEFA